MAVGLIDKLTTVATGNGGPHVIQRLDDAMKDLPPTLVNMY